MADTRTITVNFQGREITVKPFTDGQFAIAMTLGHVSGAEGLHRVFAMLGSSVGQEEWEGIVAGMTTGELQLSDVTVGLLKAIAEGTQAIRDAESQPEPDDLDAELRKAEEFLAKHRAAKDSDG